eukprot:TRINITY_DN19667_c0_g1_i1.p1 TRINITY_DN19667_c0_g1~~TRINITY_DN19667_c0_g1_i1.p1  ORF type:complete len:976 (+),score=339.84 TRINITY_DN19667_c0_g1_i1:53-2929(+)
MASEGRFTLYSLEDGEEHVADVLAEYTAGDMKGVKAKLRLGTRAVYVDPEEVRHPVVKVPYGGILGIGKNGDAVMIQCPKVTTMLKGGKVGPSEKLTIKGDAHQIKLAWERPDRFIEKLTALLTAFTEGVPYTLPDPATDYSRINFHTEPILLELTVMKMIPLRQIRAKIMLTHKALYLQCCESLTGAALQRTPMEAVLQCARRKRFYRDVAVELLLEGEVLKLGFNTETECSQFWNIITTKTNVPILRASAVESMTRRWVNRTISTYEYLMSINWAAGRSLNDLSQYPVMPWVIADYTSPHLDLDSAATYRDLSRPVGALDEARLAAFRMRKRESGEPYLYGTHYSTPCYVTYYLLRQHPEWMLLMHNGKYDKGARLFHSLPQTWDNVTRLPNDVKEVLPEFYNGVGAFLTSSDLNLGWVSKDPPVKVPDSVTLPPWASSPKDFVTKNRAALESEYVSERIHQWLDLVFGVASRGAAAEARDNLFHPMTYESYLSEDGVDFESPAVQAQLTEFGQCPAQVFTRPHPKRAPLATPDGSAPKLGARTEAHCELTADLQPPQAPSGLAASRSGMAMSGEDLCARRSDSSASPSFNPGMLNSSFGGLQASFGRQGTSTGCDFATTALPPPSIEAGLDVECMHSAAACAAAAAVAAPEGWLLRDIEAAHAAAASTPNLEIPDLTADQVDLVFVGGHAGQLPIVDATHGTRLRALQVGTETVTCVAVAESQPRVVVAGAADGAVYCYDFAAGRLEDRVETGAPAVAAVALDPSGGRLASTGPSGVRVWSVRDDASLHGVVQEWGEPAGGACWEPAGAWLAYGCEDGVRVVDPRVARGAPKYTVEVGFTKSCMFMDDAPTLLCVAASGLCALDLRAGAALWCNSREEYLPHAVARAPSTLWAATGHTIHGYDPSNGAPVTSYIPTRTPIQGLTALQGGRGSLVLVTHHNKRTYLQQLRAQGGAY